MTDSLGGPGIVLALVLAEVAIGGVAVLWVAPLWGRVKTGFFKLAGGVLAAIAILAWLAARGPLGDAASTPARVAAALLLAFAALTVAGQALLWLRAHTPARMAGVASIPAGAAALVAIAFEPAAARAPAIAIFQVLAGAVFAGAFTDGLLLGHWYLVDRKLSREPLAFVNALFLGGCALAAVAGALAISGGGTASPDLSPLLGAGALAAYLAIGLVALCATIGVFIRALVKESSIQAATGLFYLGVIMGLAAEFASKVRFF
ncbi:MAG TPA: hypothetical protein VGB83_01170 [Actinomycetota bacterium]